MPHVTIATTYKAKSSGNLSPDMPEQYKLAGKHHTVLQGEKYRKPEKGMLEWHMDWQQVLPEWTLFIGDRPEDEGAAKAAGVDFIHADKFFGA